MNRNAIQKYCSLMEESKLRLNIVSAYEAGAFSVIYRATTIESIYLQFRKILELIALGSLAANEKLCRQIYPNLGTFWNAKRILADIEQINPQFYPQPIIEQLNPQGHPHAKAVWLRKPSGYLTKQDFLDLYQKCGAIAHASNPYGSQINYAAYEKRILHWKQQIVGLLNSHTVRLVGDQNLYLIHMSEADGRVHHYVFAPSPVAPP